MEWSQHLCESFYADVIGTQANIIIDGDNKKLVTVERVKHERSKNRWVTFDKKGDYLIQIPYAQSSILVPISFCEKEDIKHVLSYRWAGAYGVPIRPEYDEAPVDFLCISATEKVWVDYLNHLNHDEMKADVITNMGDLYSSRPVHAKYLHDFSLSSSDDCRGLSTLLSCITRGWIWQEIAFTDQSVTPKGAETIALLVELIKTGSEVVRCLIDDGFSAPKEKNVNEVIKFAVDTLWRARNLADNQSAFVFFIQDQNLNRSLVEEAIKRVASFRSDVDDVKHRNVAMTMKVLAALDNLENANYTRVEDGFCASFSTLLQSNASIFGPILPGRIAPEKLHVTITDMLKSSSEQQNWDIEWWQQCVIDHPLSQLNHPKFDFLVIQKGLIFVHVSGYGGDERFTLKLSYNRPLQGQELDKSDEKIDGKHDILSLSYRIRHGELFVVGFQTKSMLRIVPQSALRVTETTVENELDTKMSSRWTQTSWYSRDVDWLNILQKWKQESDAFKPKKTPFGRRKKVAIS